MTLKTINGKIIVMIVSATIILTTTIIVMQTTNLTKISNESSIKTLNMLSTSIFQTLRVTMNFGDPILVKKELDKARTIDGVKKLKIHKSKSVIDDFGLAAILTNEQLVKDIFRDKKISITEEENKISHTLRLLKPMIATNECMGCHTNSKIGDVLGVMDLVYSLDMVDEEISNSKWSMGIFLAIFQMFGMIFVLIFFKKVLFDRLAFLNNAILNLSNSSRNSNEIQKITSKADDEISEISKSFNKYIDHIQKGLDKDAIFLDEVASISEKVSKGFCTYSIQAKANNPLLEELKINFNAMIRNTKDNIDKINNALVEFGNANYSHVVDANGASGNIGSLIQGTYVIGANVSELIAIITRAGEQMQSHTSILTQASTTLSSSANEQASALEESAASIEEITAVIKSTADNANEMTKLASQAQESSSDGMSLANETSSAMENIHASTSAIAEAITVIDQISFQTNILSLNAAVEAATAGEAGKGFAVVAGEVRNLATRSSEAASQIKELVEAAKIKSNHGKEISEQMKDKFKDVHNKINQTSSLVSDVASSSKEQLVAMEQINSTVTELDRKTQQNAQASSQVNYLSIEVASMANKLIATAKRTKYNKEAIDQVCDLDLSFDTATLKLNHISFKERYYNTLNTYKSQKVVTSSECSMGKWIEKNKNSELAKTDHWNNLLEAHKDVHSGVQNFIDSNAAKASNDKLAKLAENIEISTRKIFSFFDMIKRQNCINLKKKEEKKDFTLEQKEIYTPISSSANKIDNISKHNTIKHEENDDDWDSF
jgi:methyl-accepting chemotaxis protein